MIWALLVEVAVPICWEDIQHNSESGILVRNFIHMIPRGCDGGRYVDGCAEYTMTNNACKTRPQGLDDNFAAFAWLRVQIDSPLTSRDATSEPLELGTKPQSHHQLLIPHHIANGCRQGFQ